MVRTRSRSLLSCSPRGESSASSLSSSSPFSSRSEGGSAEFVVIGMVFMGESHHARVTEAATWIANEEEEYAIRGVA